MHNTLSHDAVPPVGARVQVVTFDHLADADTQNSTQRTYRGTVGLEEAGETLRYILRDVELMEESLGWRKSSHNVLLGYSKRNGSGWFASQNLSTLTLVGEGEASTPVVPRTPVALTVADRCDSCGAQAYVRAWFAHGELLFCGHHWRKAEGTAAPLEVQDEREKLLARN